MPRVLSLNARVAFNAQQTDEVTVVLLDITHPSLATPIRLSSDPTEMFSIDPLRYGTRHRLHEYEFVLMAALLPDDVEGAPSATSFAFENVAADMVSVFRAVTTPARLDLALVLASHPDRIEEQYTGFVAVKANYDASRVVLDVSRELVTARSWPTHHMTQARFPGQFA